MNQNKKITSIKLTLLRARIVFIGLFISLLLTTGVSFNAGWKSGEIKRNIIEPIKKPINEFKSELAKIAEEASKPAPTPRSSFEFSATGSANVEVKTNINVNSGSNTGNSQRRVIWVQPTPIIKWIYPTSTFQQRDYNKEYEAAVKRQEEQAKQRWEESLRSQEEWSKQKSAENQKWFEEQTNKNRTEGDAWFQQRTAEMQKNLDQWKIDNGF